MASAVSQRYHTTQRVAQVRGGFRSYQSRRCQEGAAQMRGQEGWGSWARGVVVSTEPVGWCVMSVAK